MMNTEVSRLVAAVEKARSSVLDCIADLTETQAAFRPAEAEWSIVEIVEHLYLAELSGVTKMWAAVSDFRAGARWVGGRPHHGKPIEEVVAETWNTKEVAPPIATPHTGGPLACWHSTFRSLTPALNDLAVQLETARLEDIVFPHFLSGPLDSRPRLEFLRYHMERHLTQIGRIRGYSSFPTADALVRR
jgi:hypothetical protein